MEWALIIGIPVALLVIYLLVKGRKYKAIYAPGHFIELAQSLQRAKDAACEKIGKPIVVPPTDDDKVFVSSAGIACAYTINRDVEGFPHHFSISIAGGYTPHAVGGMLTVYFTRLLNIPHDKLQLGISQNNVYHCVYRLTPEEHERVKQLRMAVPTEEKAKDMHHQCMEERDKLQWSRFQAA